MKSRGQALLDEVKVMSCEYNGLSGRFYTTQIVIGTCPSQAFWRMFQATPRRPHAGRYWEHHAGRREVALRRRDKKGSFRRDSSHEMTQILCRSVRDMKQKKQIFEMDGSHLFSFSPTVDLRIGRVVSRNTGSSPLHMYE